MVEQLPSREEAATAIKAFTIAEPEIRFDLHPIMKTILAAADAYASGELMTAEEAQRKKNADLSKWETERGI